MTLGPLLIQAALCFGITLASVLWMQQPKRSAPQRTKAPTKAKPLASAIPQFENATRSAGIDFRLICGGPEKRYIHESLCGGTAFLDFDNDGWLDIFLLNGSTMEDFRKKTGPSSKLYRNTGRGTFVDVTRAVGLTRRGWGMGVAVGDYDNDGWRDLYVTYFDGGSLYRNQHGKFRDVTAEAGVDNGGRWGTSAAFGDYDNDGYLDLYVVNYVELDIKNLPEFGSSVFCQYRGIPVSCGPRGLKGSRDRLYRNNRNGAFIDVSDSLSIDPEGFYGLGVVWGDYDNDGDQDIYVANDSSPSLLYQNDGKGKLPEVGLLAGVAYSADGREQAGMGVDFGDYDNDGWIDLTKTNFSDDTNNLYHNDRNGSFTDLAGPAGFGAISIPFLAFGVKFFDFNNDGRKDIFVANGHVNPQVDAHSFGVTYAQRNHLFINLGGGKFQELGKRAGVAMLEKKVSRAAAAGDVDNDGDLDILVTNLDDSPTLLRNQDGNRQSWIRIKLIGSRSNRDGLGARVEVTTGERTQIDEVRANSSYLSASDPRLHFGLDGSTYVDRIIVRWPSGTVDTLQKEAANRELVVIEGKGLAEDRARAPRQF